MGRSSVRKGRERLLGLVHDSLDELGARGQVVDHAGHGAARQVAVDGVAVAENGTVYLSTTGNFAVAGLAGADEDVFACNSAQTGAATSCASYALFLDGSLFGLSVPSACFHCV